MLTKYYSKNKIALSSYKLVRSASCVGIGTPFNTDTYTLKACALGVEITHTKK